MTLSFRRQVVQLASAEVCKRLHKEFTKELSKDFKSHAVQELIAWYKIDGDPDKDVLPLDLHKFQTHHVLPRKFGGPNTFENMALVHPDLHRQIHFLIDRQTEWIKPNERREIQIPVKFGVVWGLT